MNRSTPLLKTVCAATLMAIGLNTHAHIGERYIVTYDGNADTLKKGQKIKAQGKNWFAVELDNKGKSALMAKAGFKTIEVDAKRFPTALYNDTIGSPDVVQVTPYGYYQAQADQLSLQTGQKVCVIDSGIAEMQGETGGQNFDFNWAQITGDNDPGTGNYNADGGPHGTHVAGTIAALDNDFGVIGMAPGVPLHIVKVFNAAGWGYSSDLAQAADLCAAAGANIINMSLGGGAANSTEENAFISFTNNGGLVLAAAGNSGNSVRSYPAGYKSVMMIGAVDANNVIANFSQYPSNTINTETDDGFGVEVSAGGVGTLSTVPSDYGTGSSIVADELIYAASGMENTGSASGSSYDFGLGDAIDSGANGKICIIERGNITFAEKVLNCENSGGTGVIIFNNEPGLLYGTLGSDNVSTIPTLGATQEDGPALLASSTANISVGPSDYAAFSGTSMATPTTAGVAALVWSNHPSCTGTNIRNALKASAEDQGTIGRDDYYGYGIVKAKMASDYLTAYGCAGMEPPPPAAITLTGSYTSNGREVTLTWSGTTGTNVDVYVNASYNSTTVNNGSYNYKIKKNATYTFSICEEGSTTVCSNSITL